MLLGPAWHCQATFTGHQLPSKPCDHARLTSAMCRQGVLLQLCINQLGAPHHLGLLFQTLWASGLEWGGAMRCVWRHMMRCPLTCTGNQRCGVQQQVGCKASCTARSASCMHQPHMLSYTKHPTGCIFQCVAAQGC